MTARGLLRLVGATWPARFLRLHFNFIRGIGPNLRRQLSLKARPPAAAGPRILVPLIETSHYQVFQILALAKALELRGAQIKVLLCGSRLNGCEIKNVHASKIDPCLGCRFNHEKAVPLFGLETVNLADCVSELEVQAIRGTAKAVARAYPKEFLYQGIDVVPMTTESVVRYFYGADPRSIPAAELEDVRARHLETSMIGVDAARRLHADWRPASLMCSMNIYSAWEPYAKVFERHGIRTDVVSTSTYNYNAVVLNRKDFYLNDDRFSAWRERRGGAPLTAAEKSELEKFVSERFAGTSQVFRDYKLFGSAPAAIESLKIDPRKRNVFLFSNIHWDPGVREGGVLYDDVIKWVLDTVDILKDDPACHLYIKPHPGEVYDSTSSAKGVVDYVRERFPRLPANVTVIAPELKIRTYDLFPMVDVGVLYSGTLGVEMMLSGVPVIVAGRAPYARLKSVRNPRSRSEYVRALTSEEGAAAPDPVELELFSYFYFIKTLIPWTLTRRAFADDFKGFAFESLDELLPGKDPYLDHLCRCILDPKNSMAEDWAPMDAMENRR